MPLPAPVTAPAPALPASVQLVSAPGDMPLLQVHNRHVRAAVSVQGAQLLSFTPHGRADWLFLSPRAVFKPGEAIRGGVPVCWPWFGPDPLDQGRPAHGLARQRPWALEGAHDEADGSTTLTLCLRDDDATRALWPHRFELTLELRLGATLSLALTTHNRGQAPFTLTQALHSYLAVDHVDNAQVLGLQACHYIDKVAHAPGTPAGAPLRFTGRLDRVYQAVPSRLHLHGAAGGGGRVLDSEGSRTAVVWNPGAELAARMPDLGIATHHRFVCLETANAGDDVLTVSPGGHHRLAVTMAATDD